MAHHKSAKKRIRRNERARVANKRNMSTVRTAVKAFRSAVDGVLEGTVEKAKLSPLLHEAQSLLAKAANKGILHRNNVERRIGRLAQAMNRVEKTDVQVEASSTAKKAPAKKKTGKAKKKKVVKKKTAKKS